MWKWLKPKPSTEARILSGSCGYTFIVGEIHVLIWGLPQISPNYSYPLKSMPAFLPTEYWHICSDGATGAIVFVQAYLLCTEHVSEIHFVSPILLFTQFYCYPIYPVLLFTQFYSVSENFRLFFFPHVPETTCVCVYVCLPFKSSFQMLYLISLLLYSAQKRQKKKSVWCWCLLTRLLSHGDTPKQSMWMSTKLCSPLKERQRLIITIGTQKYSIKKYSDLLSGVFTDSCRGDQNS